MTRHIWRAADAGVMLWEPAVTIATTPQEPHTPKQAHPVTEADIRSKWLLTSLASSHSQHDLVLPSIEDVLGTYIKSEPGEHFDSVWSSSVEIPTPDTSPQRSPSYESDSTLLLSSHCPLSTDAVTTRLVASAETDRSLDDSVGKLKQPVRRILDFDMVSRRNANDIATQAPGPNDFTPLAELRKLERDPPHQWNEDERILLTILYRWYEDTNVATIPKIFNAVTGLHLRLSVVRYQFESHLILYGGRAYPEFDRVMKVPFHDPEQKYDEIHAIIEATASEFGIDLSRRVHEVRYNSGKARTAKSPQTRKNYKSLVKRAVQRERERARALRMPALDAIPVRILRLGGMTLATDPRREVRESWSDVDDIYTSPTSTTPTQPTLRVPPGTKSIAFRVWDANSRTTFDDETGFVSQVFSIWRGEYPPPFSPDGQGQQAITILTNSHLSMSGGASAFVSLSTSLLQALVKASTMEEPRIAVVALNHPLLTEPHKTLPAADVMRMLKDKGQAWWAKYKGHAERMVWASVPAESIISHFPLSALCELSDHDQACEDILGLDEISSGCKTQHVSSLFREKNNVISVSNARAMGMISRAFGMHRNGASLAHILGLVSSLVDSFQLKEISANNPYTSDIIAKAFAVSLRSRTHSVSDVKTAFRDGV